MGNYKEKIIGFFKEPMIYILIFCIFIQILTYKTIPDYIQLNKHQFCLP